MDAEKKKIWINGQFVEVSDEVYIAYMKGDRKNRYFESDLKTERIIRNRDGSIKKVVPSREDSLNRLMEDNARQFADDTASVEDAAIQHITMEALHRALDLLDQDERELIFALYFEGHSEREYAEKIGITQPAVQKRKTKILLKLKKLYKF